MTKKEGSDKVKGSPKESSNKGDERVIGTAAKRLLLLITLAGAGTWAGIESGFIGNGDGTSEAEKTERDIIESLKIGGITFDLDSSWEKVFDEGEITKELLVEMLERNAEKLSGFFNVPADQHIVLIANKNAQHVNMEIVYDIDKLAKSGDLEIKEVATTNEIEIDPGYISYSTLLHELTHALRAKSFVSHMGFEEGIAEYVEISGYPNAIEELDSKYMGASVFDFIDAFPDLEQVPIEDVGLGWRQLNGMEESKLEDVVRFKHESRRRAWARFLSQDGNENFLRNLQDAQLGGNKDHWPIEQALELGDEINPKFSGWFSSEGVFQPSKPGKVAKVMYTRDSGILTFLTFEHRAIQKKDPRYPDVYEMVPFNESIIVNMHLKKGKEIDEMKATVKLDPRGIIQNFDIGQMLSRMKLDLNSLEWVEASLSDGEGIPMKVL